MRRAAAALLCLLLLCACAAPEQADALPQELVGSWASAGSERFWCRVFMVGLLVGLSVI